MIKREEPFREAPDRANHPKALVRQEPCESEADQRLILDDQNTLLGHAWTRPHRASSAAGQLAASASFEARIRLSLRWNCWTRLASRSPRRAHAIGALAESR